MQETCLVVQEPKKLDKAKHVIVSFCPFIEENGMDELDNVFFSSCMNSQKSTVWGCEHLHVF
jgi:hypothetical protein